MKRSLTETASSAVAAYSDWNQLERLAVEWLQTLLRFDTSNPPGNEQPAIEWLADVVRGEGLEPRVVISGPKRANLVVRLPGDGSLAPILLTGHADVVPAPADAWTHPPFDGVIADNCVWGRGALDMKSTVAIFTAVLVLMKRLAIKLPRDLILAVVADEETGGQYGSQYMVEQYPELVQAEYALGEMGGFSMHLGGKRFYPIQVAEKGHCRLTLNFSGTSSHGSLPSEDNALAKAAQAAGTLATTRFPYHRSDIAIAFLTTLADNLPFPQSLGLRALLNRGLAKVILERLPDRKLARTLIALLHNTANPTMIAAGTAVNVVPDHATLQLDGRILPGQSLEEFLTELRSIIGENYELATNLWLPPVQAPIADPILAVMAAALRTQDPDAIALPYLMPGFTDAKHFSKLGTKFYGFVPMKLDEAMVFQETIHGVDERIPLDALGFGIKVLANLLTRLDAKSPTTWSSN